MFYYLKGHSSPGADQTNWITKWISLAEWNAVETKKCCCADGYSITSMSCEGRLFYFVWVRMYIDSRPVGIMLYLYFSIGHKYLVIGIVWSKLMLCHVTYECIWFNAHTTAVGTRYKMLDWNCRCNTRSLHQVIYPHFIAKSVKNECQPTKVKGISFRIEHPPVVFTSF